MFNAEVQGPQQARIAVLGNRGQFGDKRGRQQRPQPIKGPQPAAPPNGYICHGV